MKKNSNNIKARFFPKGIKRSLKFSYNKYLNNVSGIEMERAFGNLGIKDGSVVCVHAMVSGLGYIKGGCRKIIESLRNAVPGVTVMMPAFPFSGTVQQYLESKSIYNPLETPSTSGLLSEEFRKMPESIRGLHPTHPCAAMGPKAEELLDGAEKSITPFGDDSTYGRFSKRADSVLLLLHTNKTSIVHRVQEMVSMPNLFIDERFKAKTFDPETKRAMENQVYAFTPQLPLFVVGRTSESCEPLYVWLPDYCLLFPEYNRKRIMLNLNRSRMGEKLAERHADFISTGIYSIQTLKKAEIMAVKVKPWINRVTRDLMTDLNSEQGEYAMEKLLAAKGQGKMVIP